MIFDTEKLLSYFPLVLTAIFGALNDNLIKTIIIVFAAMSVPADQAASVGLLAGGLLMAPFVLFSGWAGILADRYEKARLIRIAKLCELGLAVAATGAMALGNLPLMLGVVFLMGTQSAFFGPLKLGWLPERLRPDQLVSANSWLDTGTFLAILAGTVAGGLIAGAPSLVWGGVAAIAIALVGFYFAWMLPVKAAAAPELHLPWNPLAGNWRVLKALARDRVALRAAILDSWFWAVGSVYLSTLPAYLRLELDGDETLLTAVLALFAVGIGAGAFFAAARLKGRASAAMILPSIVLVSIASFGLWFGFDKMTAGSGLSGLFLSLEGGFLVAMLFAVAFGGGAFAVPLKALVQARAEAGERAQVMAGFNMTSSLAIVGASVAVSIAISAGAALSQIYLGVGLSAVLAGVLSIAFFPRAALQGLGRAALKLFFRVEVEGREHLAQDGPVVFVSNHVSFLDGPALFSLIDAEPAIAVNTDWAKGPLLRQLGRVLKIAPVDPQRPMAAKGLAHSVRAGGSVLVFPEGRISTHAGLMKIYPGSAWLVDAADAPIVPVTIEGLEASIWTRPIPGLRRRIFPKLRIRVGAPRRLDIDPALKGRMRREAATRALQDMLETCRYDGLASAASLPHAFTEARRLLNERAVAASDPMGTVLSRRKIAQGAAAFSGALQRLTGPGERVGVLLPGVAAAPVVLMGLWRAGRTAAILNPTLGAAPMLSAIRTAGISQVLTSRDFVEKAGIAPLVAALGEAGIGFLWTDDIKASIGLSGKLSALRAAGRATDVEIGPETEAVVLFTSGTEGAPKGVVLSHGNLLANVAQLRARTDVSSCDRVLSALPLFHSFGLTAGVLLPLMAGAPVMFYPSPLHYRIVPEMAYSHQATLVFGTDTFLAGWGRRASNYDFASVRAAIAGAEPVKPATRALWADKFGVRILEGYGATEAGPVISLNTPMENRPGTVGRLLPRIEMRLEDAPGIAGKRLYIRGPNIMAGYLLHGQDGLQGLSDGWYDTGDIVDVDAQGCISIVGRAKRFAKVGGEMVSLAAAEAMAARVWPDAHVAAIAIKDPRKGERVLMITSQAGAARSDLSTAARAEGVAEILVPSEVLHMDRIPLLASGKIDYPALTAALHTPAEAAA